MPTIPDDIDALDGLTPPSQNDPDNFRADGDEFLGAFPTLQDQINTTAGQTYDNAVEAAASAVSAAAQVDLAADQVDLAADQVALAQGHADDAEASAGIAAATANFVGNWADQTGALNKPASVSHDGSIWLLNVDLVDVTASEPGDANNDWTESVVGVEVPLGSSLGVGGTMLSVPSGFVQHDQSIVLSSATYPAFASIFDANTIVVEDTLISDNPENGGNFGYSVAVSASYIAVGAYQEDAGDTNDGRVYVFNTSTGVLIQTLVSPSPESSGQFGYSVSITDTYLAVGARGESSNDGRVYVYTESAGTFGSPQTLNTPNTGEDGNFGQSVSITDNYLAVGAPGEDPPATSSAGRTYIYTNSGGTYGSVQTLVSPNAEASGQFGHSVSITDTYLAVGAYRENGGASDSGRAYIYTNSGGTYGSVQTLVSPNAEANGFFGFSVSITDNYLAVGARGEDGDAISSSGRTYIYTNSGGTYGSVQTLVSPNAEASGLFGDSVSITDTYLAVGAYNEDGGAVNASGRAYIYTNSGGTYGSVQTLVSPNAEASGQFGFSADITGDILSVGAPQEDAGDTNDGRVYVYDVTIPGYLINHIDGATNTLTRVS